jgi:enoyl-CoA hydratase
MAETIGYALHDRIARITVDDGKVNVMTGAFFDAFDAVLDRTERDAAGAVVIAGRPGVFSAGLDLKTLPTLPAPELRAAMLAFGRTMLRVFTFPIPTVAAVTGHAVAGGALLAFACDLRWFAAGSFKLQLNEVAIGLPLPTWAIALAHAAIPRRWHTEAILHARAYAPEEALDRGIADGLVPPDRLLAAATDAALPLTRLDQPSYATSKARHRAQAVQWASALLDAEMGALPARAAR